MKKLLTLITLSVLLFSGCSDDETVNSQGGGAIGSVTGISGKIMNMPAQSGLNIAFTTGYSPQLRSSSIINNEGVFSISALPQPRENMFTFELYPRFEPSVKFIENTLVCSDTSVRICTSNLIIRRDSLHSLGNVYRQNYNNMSWSSDVVYQPGNFSTNYIYANRNVSLKGKLEYTYAVRDPYSKEHFVYEGHITTIYDISYRKGWNKHVMYVKYWNTEVQSGKIIYTGTIQYLDREPGTACFYYQSYPNELAPKGQEDTKPQYRINPLGIEQQ